jgi:hypothetical protein
MLEIQLEMSKSIKLTPEHFVYVKRGDNLLHIASKFAQIGDKMINVLENKEVKISGIRYFSAKQEDTVAIYSSTLKLVANEMLVSSVVTGDLSEYWIEGVKFVSSLVPSIPHHIGEFFGKAS